MGGRRGRERGSEEGRSRGVRDGGRERERKAMLWSKERGERGRKGREGGNHHKAGELRRIECSQRARVNGERAYGKCAVEGKRGCVFHPRGTVALDSALDE